MPELFLISGDDDFAVKTRARKLAAELGGGAPETSETLEIVEGSEVRPEVAAGAFLDALRTPPFLTDFKVVWLRHCAFLGELCEAAGSKKRNALSEAADFLNHPFPPGLSVLIDGPGLDQRRSYVKQLKARGAMIEVFNALKSNDRNFAGERRTSIQEWSRGVGKKIDPAAVAWLTEVLGGDSGALHQELEKVAAYAGESERITVEDCRAICSRTPEAVSWGFTSALVEGNAREALKLLDQLLAQGDDELRVLAAVSGEFQRLLQVRLALSELGITRVSPRTFDALPPATREQHPDNLLLSLHPYRAFKMCEGAARFDERTLARALREILRANRLLVSGGGEPRLILEQLIFRLTGDRDAAAGARRY